VFYLGLIIGAVIFTALASRLWLALLKKISNPKGRLYWAHAASLLSLVGLRMLFAQEFTIGEHAAAMVLYAVGQVGWLMLDLRRFERGGSI
jgi:hypothetical protein